MKKKRLRYALWLSFLTASIVTCLQLYGFLEPLELKTLDARFNLRGPQPLPKETVIVVIDERSIDRLGRWPWPRRIHANLVNKLSANGAKSIIFDLLFPEPDRYDPKGDNEFARAILASRRTVMGMAFETKAGDEPKNPLPPIPLLLESASSLGHVNHIPDSDGVGRKVSVYAGYNGVNIPSIALAGYAMYKGTSVDEILLQEHLPVDISSWHQMELNFAGEFESFTTYSYCDVLDDAFPKDAFRDKIVLVGGTATALFDRIAVPNIPVYPGVGIHATAINNLIHKKYLRHAPVWLSFVEIWIICILFGLSLYKLAPWIGAFTGILLAGSQFAGCYWLFYAKNINLEFVAPALSLLGVYILTTFYRLLTEEREKRWIKNTFSQYLSPKVIEVITQDPNKLRLGGEEKNMTVLFSDLAGFTTIAESLKPQELVGILNTYLTAMTEIIFRYAGVVDKYIGDAIMAFWNAPLDQNQHAYLACLAAIKSQERLGALRDELIAKGFPSISSRIGINTGNMVVGNMGSQNRFNYTVMGDAVNLASRLEGANKTFGTKIMISEFTYETVKGSIEARELDLLRVKGKLVPIKVYELLGENGQLSTEQKQGIAKYHEGLAYYRDKRFEPAADKFTETLNFLPHDTVAKLYVDRCQKYLSAPPPDNWDGVFVMTTK